MEDAADLVQSLLHINDDRCNDDQAFLENYRRRRTWAELSFSGRGPDPPLHHRQILFSTNQIFHQNVLVSDRTDGRTDRQAYGQTGRRNKYVLGLPSFKKLSSE